MKTGRKTVGLTKNAGFEFGLRKTFGISLTRAWQFLISPIGIRLWLGDVPDFHLEKGSTYQTTDGTTGEVRVFNPEVNIRLTWLPKDWPKSSTLQMRVIPTGDKTTISFHHENLPDEQSRELMRLRWETVMAAIEKQLPV